MTGADERSNTAIVVAGGGELVVGDTYEVRHSRKGTFTGIVRAIRGEWIDVEITQGVAKAIMRYNVVYEGEVVTVRAGHSYFIKVVSP